MEEVEKVVETMKNTKLSKHLRITFVGEDYNYDHILSKYFSEYVFCRENIDSNLHYHIYCVLNCAVTTIRTAMQVNFPKNKGNEGHSLTKCRTSDWANLCYVVKNGDLISKNNISDELYERARTDSYVPSEKTKGVTTTKWRCAKIAFDNKFLMEGELKKQYEPEDVLDFCLQYYKDDGPFSDDHVMKLYNYLLINSKYENQCRASIKQRLISKYNLSL